MKQFIAWLFGRKPERKQASFAPGLAARMRWASQVQEAQGREHAD